MSPCTPSSRARPAASSPSTGQFNATGDQPVSRSLSPASAEHLRRTRLHGVVRHACSGMHIAAGRVWGDITCADGSNPAASRSARAARGSRFENCAQEAKSGRSETTLPPLSARRQRAYSLELAFFRSSTRAAPRPRSASRARASSGGTPRGSDARGIVPAREVREADRVERVAVVRSLFERDQAFGEASRVAPSFRSTW